MAIAKASLSASLLRGLIPLFFFFFFPVFCSVRGKDCTKSGWVVWEGMNQMKSNRKQRSWREDEGVQAWCLSGQDRWWIVYEVWGW
jgi:hypothetical protein